MYNFILEFHNTNLYVIPLVIYEMKWNLLTPMLILLGSIFLK
jgi:hypothetical protein